MRNFGIDNHVLILEAATEDLILSGFATDKPAGSGGNGGSGAEPGAGNAGGTGGAGSGQGASGAAGGSNTDLIALDDKSDVILRDVVSKKFSDLGAVRLNKNGDVVNVEGAVLIAKADIDKDVNLIKTERTTKAEDYLSKLGTVEYQGVPYEIQEDGSLKDKDGNVVLSKESLLAEIMSTDDYLSVDDPNDDVFEQASVITGIELLDENGNKLSFEPTAQGIAQRDLYIARQEGSRLAKESINKFFNDYPELQDAFYYYKTKGSLNGFGTQTNHEGIVLDKTNDNQLYAVFVEGEIARGLSKEVAVKRADLFKKNDLLYEEASNALAYMVEQEKEEKLLTKQEYESQQQALREQHLKFTNEVKTKIESGKVLDYIIPENIRIARPDGTIVYRTKADFFNYITQPVANNLTQAQLDSKAESLDVKMFYDYLRYTNNNMSYIIDQKVKDSKVAEFKNKFAIGNIPGRKLIIKGAAKTSNDNIAI